MNKTLFLLILLLSIYVTAATAEEKNPESMLLIENAWIAEAPPVSKVMVAYMTIKNTASQAIEIVRAESKIYSSIEFHETKHEDGMARMLRHDSLTIPAASSIQLKRGGKHLMLFNPTKPLKAGDSVIIKLTTKNNSSETVSVPVVKSQF